MFRNTMSSAYCTASASSSAEAGMTRPSCADKTPSASGISLLVSVFLVIFGLCAAIILTGCGLVSILISIITVPVLILIINAVIITPGVLKAQEQNA